MTGLLVEFKVSGVIVSEKVDGISMVKYDAMIDRVMQNFYGKSLPKKGGKSQVQSKDTRASCNLMSVNYSRFVEL